MIKILSNKTNIDFIGKRNICFAGSMAIIVLGFISLFIKGGFNVGVDFKGGTIVQILFEKQLNIEEIRSSLKGIGFGESEIQYIGNEKREFIIRANSADSSLKDVGKLFKDTLTGTIKDNKIEIRRVEMVGPKVGKDLTNKAFFSFLYAIIFMLIYVWWRFELSFGIGAILALVHDVFVSLAFVSLFGIEFDLKIVAAILTIVGFSINDTIVIYDRIRETMGTSKGKNYIHIINKSINETLSRTILTSLTVVIVVFVLFFFGGEVIHGFSFVLLVGFIAGTYSSIYIASPIVLLWDKSPGKKLSAASTTAK